MSIIGRVKSRAPRSQTVKDAILLSQGNVCFYCGIAFGEWFMHKNRLICVKVNWDHFVPFAFCERNTIENYVAACTECNTLKSSHVFDCAQTTIDYVRTKRLKRGLPLLPLPRPIQETEAMAKVLLGKLPHKRLLETSRRCSHCGKRTRPEIFPSTRYCSKRCSNRASARREFLRQNPPTIRPRPSQPNAPKPILLTSFTLNPADVWT